MTAALHLAGALAHGPADKRIEILRRVAAAGSISQAARDAGVSYKAAWQALDTLSNLAGTALVERAVGGAGGGGAVLTQAGERLLAAADELGRSREQALARLGAGPAAQGAAALGLRTSMRNQLPCAVASIRGEGGAQQVRLQLPGGDALVAKITRESVQLLGLRRGLAVLALFKATAVQVASRLDIRAADNVLRGRVTRSSRGAGEVAVEIEGHQQVVGFADASHGLRAGGDAMVVVADSAVVIALP